MVGIVRNLINYSYLTFLKNHQRDRLKLWACVEILRLSSFACGVLYPEPIFLHTSAKCQIPHWTVLLLIDKDVMRWKWVIFLIFRSVLWLPVTVYVSVLCTLMPPSQPAGQRDPFDYPTVRLCPHTPDIYNHIYLVYNYKTST
jgi:hypothetical protein